MEPYRHILRVAGRILLLVGGLEALRFFLHIAFNETPPFPMWLCLLLAGILLMRGSLRAARCINFCAAGLLVMVVGWLLLFPVLFPLSYLLAMLHQYPVDLVEKVWVFLGLFSFSSIMYRLLTAPVVRVMLYRSRTGAIPRKPYVGFIVGAIFFIIVAQYIVSLRMGEIPAKARVEAVRTVGSEYELYVTGYKITHGRTSDHIKAEVVAYNSNEMWRVPVEWQEPVDEKADVENAKGIIRK